MSPLGDSTTVFAQYTILSHRREIIHNKLKENNIPSVSYYTVPLHLQPVFKTLKQRIGDFPVAEKVANHCLSLPMSPYLSENDHAKVVNNILVNFD